MRAAREAWFENQPAREPAKLVFIDETAATTTMARRRGRAARGVRCKAAIPHRHGMTTSCTAGLRRDGIAAPLLREGPIDGAAVRASIEPLLVPTLTIGDTVIMDHLPAHKGAGVRDAIEAAGAKLVYLPPPASAGAGSTPLTSTRSRWHFQSSRR